MVGVDIKHLKTVAVFIQIVAGQAYAMLAVKGHDIWKDDNEITGLGDFQGHLKILNADRRVITSNSQHSVTPIYRQVTANHKRLCQSLREIKASNSTFLFLLWQQLSLLIDSPRYPPNAPYFWMSLKITNL